MAGHSMNNYNDLYAEVYDYSTLEAAFEAASFYLSDDAIDGGEEWLMNLHNHLVWQSYEEGKDPDEDCVVLTAIDHVLKERGLRLDDVEEPILRRIIADLTLN